MSLKKCRTLHSFFSFLLVLLLLPSCACVGKETDAKRALTEFCERYDALPRGSIYFTNIEPYKEGYLSPTLADALYRDGEHRLPLASLLSGAVFLGASLDTPYEAAILSCRTYDEADSVARLCLKRLSLLKQKFPASSEVHTAEVKRIGRTVIYTILPDNALAFSLLEEILF